ncbi:transposase, partial [bacterium]|nr:transposase [bacterium]
MARPARIDLPDYHYHVISRGQRKNPLFFSPDDRKKYFEILNKLLIETDIDIYAYSLMTNHVHFDIFRNNYPIQIFMKRLNTTYAIYFNKKYNLIGHVFQGRYISKIVLDERQLIYLIKYIHLNALRAGIVEYPGDYSYSSARFYEGFKEKNLVRIKRLPQFENKELYLKFMDLDEIILTTYRDSIGDKEAYLSLEKRKLETKKEKFVEQRTLKQGIRKDAQFFSEKLNIDLSRLLESKWDRIFKQKKILIIKELVKLGYNFSEIAR